MNESDELYTFYAFATQTKKQRIFNESIFARRRTVHINLRRKIERKKIVQVLAPA